MTEPTRATSPDRTWLHDMLGELLGEPTAELDGTEDLRDHGLDSIRAFELVQRLREVAPGVEFADVVSDTTIDGLERLAGVAE